MIAKRAFHPHEKRQYHFAILSLQRGFTLIELLVVIAILSLLVSVLLPSLQKARDLAKMTVCLANIRNIGLAMHMYLSEHEEEFPTFTELTFGDDQTMDGSDYLNDPSLFSCPSDMLPRCWTSADIRQCSYGYNIYLVGDREFSPPSSGAWPVYPNTFPRLKIDVVEKSRSGPATIIYAMELWKTNNVWKAGPSGGTYCGLSGAPSMGYTGTTYETRSDGPYWDLHKEGGNYAFVDGHAGYLDYWKDYLPKNIGNNDYWNWLIWPAP